ncbi:MAG: hypothetical protein ACJZ59_04555 [Candidatus Thalassarchaeaceae archaeon]
MADIFPDNPTQWEDADGDGLGDNQSGTESRFTFLFDFDNDGYIDALDILPKLASPRGSRCRWMSWMKRMMFHDNPRECNDNRRRYHIGDNEDLR